MDIFWYIALTFMFCMYVILDGFDLGVGIIHFLVGKNESERSQILEAIGPFWDGNEVWLIAAGGTLYFAFPRVYASSFSGFYLPFMIVLWLLILRALGIELRHQLHHPLWVKMWDRVFSLSSLLLSIFLGAAHGNLIRGVPLNSEGFFFVPLWTSLLPDNSPGVIDWFTLLFAGVAVSTFIVHGANWLAFKTNGEIQHRARILSRRGWYGVTVISSLAIAAVTIHRVTFWENFLLHPWGFLFILLSILSWLAIFHFNRQQKDLAGFLSSSLFILGMFATTSFAQFPIMLYSINDANPHLTVYNSSVSSYGQHIGLIWWIVGMLLAIAYFVYLFYMFRGKVSTDKKSVY